MVLRRIAVVAGLFFTSCAAANSEYEESTTGGSGSRGGTENADTRDGPEPDPKSSTDTTTTTTSATDPTNATSGVVTQGSTEETGSTSSGAESDAAGSSSGGNTIDGTPDTLCTGTTLTWSTDFTGEFPAPIEPRWTGSYDPTAMTCAALEGTYVVDLEGGASVPYCVFESGEVPMAGSIGIQILVAPATPGEVYIGLQSGADEQLNFLDLQAEEVRLMRRTDPVTFEEVDAAGYEAGYYRLDFDRSSGFLTPMRWEPGSGWVELMPPHTEELFVLTDTPRLEFGVGYAGMVPGAVAQFAVVGALWICAEE